MDNINIQNCNNTVIIPRREYASLVRASEKLSLITRLAGNKEIPSYAIEEILKTLLDPRYLSEVRADDEV